MNKSEFRIVWRDLRLFFRTCKVTGLAKDCQGMSRHISQVPNSIKVLFLKRHKTYDTIEAIQTTLFMCRMGLNKLEIKERLKLKLLKTLGD